MDSAKVFGGGIVSYFTGTGLIPQILLTIVFFIALQIVMNMIQYVADMVRNLSRQVVPLQPNTVAGSYVIGQSPTLPKQIYNSNNELNGLEYSYSLFVFVAPETFTTSSSQPQSQCGPEAQQTSAGNRLRHVFHKGSRAIFPLMSPGVFLEGDNNTMRVYMNSSTTWNNYVSVPNIPISKWFHLVIMMRGKYMDVYINGNVSARQQFSTVPKLNVGNVYIMSPQQFPLTNNPNVTTDFVVNGPMRGFVSGLTYYSYALTYSQIEDIYRRGPSPVIVNPSAAASSFNGVIPPYLHDDWWVTKY
jgi:hypothetical protein